MSATAKKVMKVADVMTREPVCAERHTTIRQLARMLEEYEISGVPVVDQSDRLIGVVSKSDLIRRCTEGTSEQAPGYMFELLAEDMGEETELMPEPLIVVEDFMTADPITAKEDERLAVVAHRMAESSVHRLIVVDKERKPVGIVTSLDLLKVFPD